MEREQTKKVTRSEDTVKDLSPTVKKETGVKGGRLIGCPVIIGNIAVT